MSQPFIRRDPRPEDYWRSIILFGRNVATYKFALARALLDLQPPAGSLVTLEQLAVPFSRYLCEHLRGGARQGTFGRGQFLEDCRRANAGELRQDELVERTVRSAFNDVIDAFHIVGQAEVPKRFFLDERASNRGLRVTDALGELVTGEQATNLPAEAEARWRLVETAWDLRLTPSLINHDPDTEGLFVIDAARRRRSVAPARPALSGYQKGHCFYCFDSFSLEGAVTPDVDHVFPHSLKIIGIGAVDQIWNLVLACRRCNRGVGGKFDRVPSLRLLERLHTRNEFLISSHHPLRDTLMAQTGASAAERVAFLNTIHSRALSALVHEWEPAESGDPLL